MAGPDERTTDPVVPRSNSSSAYTVEITVPEQSTSLRARQGIMRIGRDTANGVVIDDWYVSRTHAEVRISPLGVEIVDLGSKNGTIFQGSKFRRLPVRSNVSVILGRHCTLQVRLLDELRPGLCPGIELLGHSPAMELLRTAIENAASAPDATLLIEGEVGSGKEVVARTVHARSIRAPNGFVIQPCATVSTDLFSTQFLQRATETTGSRINRTEGLLGRASGGTLLLDEVGDLSRSAQRALTTVLKSARREISRMNVRIVSTSRKDLRAEVRAGRFSKDLFALLAQVQIEVPPLRAREGDVTELAAHFAAALEATIAPDVQKTLSEQDWPGNVRQLRNTVERQVMLAGGPGAMVHKLEEDLDDIGWGQEYQAFGLLQGSDSLATAPTIPPAFGFDANEGLPPGIQRTDAPKTIDEALESEYLVRLLYEARLSLTEASRLSGIDRNYLHQLYCKHGIDLVLLRALYSI